MVRRTLATRHLTSLIHQRAAAVLSAACARGAAQRALLALRIAEEQAAEREREAEQAAERARERQRETAARELVAGTQFTCYSVYVLY